MARAPTVGLDELASLLVPGAVEEWSPLDDRPALVVDLDAGRWAPDHGRSARLAELPCVTIGLTADPDLPADLVEGLDIVLTGPAHAGARGRAAWVAVGDPSAEAARLVERVAAQPLASAALVALLRLTDRLPVWEAVAAEAATYSMLLGSRAFLAWREATPRRPPPPPEPEGPVVMARAGAVLTVALNRPAARNAVDSAVRDGLVGAMALVADDPTIERVVLVGRGPSFSAGGDLNEFGTVGDPALAHVVRLTRHPGMAVARVAERVEARMHGVATGSGIEIPAFAGRLVADPDAEFGLPELGMGLVPGAGGCASITARIGRHRTNWLVVSGERIGAARALEWGLVDDIEPVVHG